MMKKDSALYDLTQQVQGTVFQAAFTAYRAKLSDQERSNRPPTPAIFHIRQGYAESPGWMMAQVQEFYPEPLTVQKFRVRAVYSAPGLSFALLELLASEKILDRVGEEYHLTDAGQAFLNDRSAMQVMPFKNSVPIPPEDIVQLEKMLSRIIDSSMARDDPPGIWCLAHSRNRAPDTDSALAKIIHHFSDLNAFRDDAHMAAYKPYMVDGHVWEAFDFVSQGQASDAEALFDQLAYRGFSRTDWQAALDELSQRGWIKNETGDYKPTETGREVWATVEKQTDAYFYAPWDCLSDGEFETLCALLQNIEEGCKQAQTTA